MGLPANPPQVIVNGADPGDQGAGENGEADLDVEWSGAVAKNATIKFVISKSTITTDGVDLSAQYIVNNNLAPVMSTSFGLCESQMGAAENAFYNNLWKQAACPGDHLIRLLGRLRRRRVRRRQRLQRFGPGVNGLASTPYNVAVGGTQFNDGSGSYWNSTNGTGERLRHRLHPGNSLERERQRFRRLRPLVHRRRRLHALRQALVAGCPRGPGRRQARHSRCLPHRGRSRRLPGADPGRALCIGGTSASSPSFAGLMALIVQKTGQRQGNANIRFYQLGNAQYGSGGAAVFHDTISGNNSVPGVTGYSCTTGYDLATGLGSVDAYALVTNWGMPDLTIASTHTGNFTQGQSGAQYTITVTNSGSGATTGTVTVTDTLPSGLAATALSGAGWSCTLGTLTCTRSDVLAAGASYPAITLTVNVANNAPASVTTTATVAGGGELNSANDTASDVTTIIQMADLTVTKGHTGNFGPGQTGAQYTITVTNSGPGPTTGTVAMTDTLPVGLTATALSGNGWTCGVGTLTCTRSDVLAAVRAIRSSPSPST